MPDDTDAIVDDLLIRWHQWRQGYRPSRGFSNEAAGCGDYVTSRQYDDANGALDDALEDRIMRQVEHEVSALSVVHQAAIQVQARALVLGCVVFTSPRLPADRAQREQLVREARSALLRRLQAAGVV